MESTHETVVAVVAARPETVLADYARLLDLAGPVPPADVSAEHSWSLVPAASGGRIAPASACPPWQLEGVVRALVAAGHRPEDIALTLPLSQAGNGPVVQQWRRVLAGCDVDGAADVPRGSSRLLLTNLRTHGRLGLAGAVALQALAANLDPETGDAAMVAESLEESWKRNAAGLAGAVIDATVAGDGTCGSALMPVAAHLILAGRDPVAVDAVACRLVGLDPNRVPLVGSLASSNLGCADLAAIELVGDTDSLPDSLDLVAARRFRTGAGDAGPRWWRRWRATMDERWPRPLLRRRARRRYENQAWGRLHAEYDRRGSIGQGEH